MRGKEIADDLARLKGDQSLMNPGPAVEIFHTEVKEYCARRINAGSVAPINQRFFYALFNS